MGKYVQVQMQCNDLLLGKHDKLELSPDIPRYHQKISPEIWDLIFLGQNARRLSAGLYYLCRFSGPAVYSSDENLVEKSPEISWNYITMVGLGLSCNIVLVIEIILDNMINIDQ